MRKRYYNKIISIVLAISILITSGHIDVYADQVKETFGNIKKTSQEVDNSKKEKVIKKTESSTVYQLEDGMKREVIHDSNIRFKEDGKLVDYDPSLVKVNNNKTHNNADISKYAYENKKGDNKNYIPKKISQETPIILEKENYQITISPINKETNQVKVEDQNILDIYDKEIQIPVKATYEAKDEKSSLEYISQDNGIKENIVLNEAPESNIFEYEMKLDGVKPKKLELEESIVFIDDATGEAVGSIDAPFMNDASNKAYSEDITYDIKPKDGESDKYILTMTVDNTYLQSSERQYPVTIDPTVTWSGDSNIIDTYIISGTKYGDTNFYSSGTTAFPVGRGTNGVHRALIKGRKLASTVDGKYVHKATLTMYETSNNDVSNVVRAYRMIKDWNEKTVTWNNRPDYSTSDGYYGTVTTTGTLYKARVMDLTNYARKVANKSITDYGLVLRSSDEGVTTGKYSKFFGSRHAGTDIRPKFTVEYYDGPTTASTLKLSSSYLKVGETFKLDWAGIDSKSLSRVEYRIAPYNDADGVVGSDLFKYADSPNLGATSSGSKDITKIKELKEGCYRIYVRGVDSGGIKGTGKGATFHIDSTLPVISSLVASPTSSSTNQIKSQNIALSWKIDEKHLKDVQYNIDGGTFTTVESAGVTNSKFTIPSSKFKTSKTYKIGLKAIDKSGNASAIKYINVYVDAIAPDISKLDLLDSNETSISGNWTKEINPKLNFSNVLETGSGVNLSKVQYALVNEKSSAPASDKYISPKNIKFTSEKNPYEGYLYLDSEVKTGSYDLYIKMLDIAGNTSIKSVNYKKDTEKPNGSIEVKNATESIDVLTDTVYITGAVSDGSGSGIKSSDVKFYKLDASGEIDKNFKPVIVYENATISNTQAFDTRKLNNGQYILKLNMEDNVGYKVEASKKIRVANKIKAPKLTSDLIKDNPCTIKWAYDNNDVLISRIQYKINEEDKWIDVPNSNANSGSFKVNLPEETGEYKVKVRAIDSQGVEGEEGIVICKVDKKAPIVNINSVDKGIIRGTATDENFSEWEIYIKKENEEDSKYEKVLNGKNRVDENILGILDLSSFEIGTYVIKLLGKDTVGNENSFTHRIEKTKDFVNAELIEPKFRVEREYYQNYSSNKIILPPTKKELKLKSDGLNFITRLLGTTTWYIENKNVGTGNTYNDDFYVKSPSNANAKYEENKDYQISVVNKDLFGGVKYSMPLVKNYEIEKVNLSNENITNGAIVKDVKLQEKIASFRLIDSNSSKNLKYEVKIGDGDYKEIKSE
ncbi:MAG: DNRLRE domain-containing protein, partial [Terrisporobacter sp.]|uniref:DNRLRE domain-containing protein n=1 Tax=Terrisporobacter sp. TaxID=1965305 RepID=UPI002FC8A197